MKPTASIICDSISPDGVRLTTFEVVMHRFVLAEFNTHRVFSRNSASSRAIPIEKMMARAYTEPAMPVQWGTNQPGMQAGVELPETEQSLCKQLWSGAASSSVDMVSRLHAAKLHKQVANRLLEPFMWHTAVVTAVDFDNFFWQRCHPDAQPEMKAAADAMQLAYYTSKPTLLGYHDWHLPFIRQAELHALPKEELKKVSTARCARVSYKQHDGTRDWLKDLDLFSKLEGGMHASPFEHVATPCTHARQIKAIMSDGYVDGLEVVCKHTGNFRYGWHQYRKEFEWENRTNFEPNHPELVGVK
jgi:thymidylate synthase ThyX